MTATPPIGPSIDLDLPRRDARRSRASRFGRGVLVGLAAICIAAQSAGLAGAGWALANPRTVSDVLTVWRFEPSVAVADIAQRAGFSERGAFLFEASTPELVAAERFDVLCSRDEPGVGVLGCYTFAEGRIYLFDITNDELADLEVVVAAHEMLHAAWDRLTEGERAALEEPLEAAFAALGPDHELVERIAAYEDVDPRSRVPELYAILGTEIADLPPELEEHYREFFDDRSVVVALWSGINAIFVALEQQLTELSAELERLSAEIDEEQRQAERDADQLEADITAFNERAARPGGYTSQSAFERDRDELLSRQRALNDRIDATNAKVDEYNALVEEFTTLNEQAAALDRDLNIDVELREPTEASE